MTTRKCVLALMFLAACGVCRAADDETGGLRNGRFWMSKGMREESITLIHLTYLMGACDVDSAGFGITLRDGQPPRHNCATVLNFGEISEAITAFYSEPENMAVPVVRAMFFVKRKAEGASSSELEALKAGMRKLAAADKEAK